VNGHGGLIFSVAISSHACTNENFSWGRRLWWPGRNTSLFFRCGESVKWEKKLWHRRDCPYCLRQRRSQQNVVVGGGGAHVYFHVISSLHPHWFWCAVKKLLSLIYLRQRRRYTLLPVFVCLSVCLLARLLKNACMDLDEMLRVNRCRDMGKSTYTYWQRAARASRGFKMFLFTAPSEDIWEVNALYWVPF